MADFDKLAEVGQRLIGENSRLVNLVKHNRDSIGLRHRQRDAVNDVTIPNINATFVGYKTRQIDGDVIRNGDKLILISPNDIPSGVTDDIEDFNEIIDGNIGWNIIKVDIVQPAAVPVLYKIQARR